MDDNSLADIEIPANNILTGLDLITLINDIVDNTLQNRIGYYTPADLRDGEIWVKSYQDYPDDDAGQPSNLREVYIYFKNIVLNGEFKGDQLIKLGNVYVGENNTTSTTILNTWDLYSEENLSGKLCPVNNGSIPIKVIPDLSSFYYTKVDGKTLVYADVTDGKISKDIIRETVLDETQGNRPNGYAKLDTSGKIDQSVLPTNNYVLTTDIGKANGVCPLDATGKVPSERVPQNVINYIENNLIKPSSISFRGNTLVTFQKGGNIDFHFNNSDADYTSRIIENAEGRIEITAPNGVTVNGNKVATQDEALMNFFTDSNGYWVERPMNNGQKMIEGFGYINCQSTTSYTMDLPKRMEMVSGSYGLIHLTVSQGTATSFSATVHSATRGVITWSGSSLRYLAWRFTGVTA